MSSDEAVQRAGVKSIAQLGRLPLYLSRRRDGYRATHPPDRHLCLPDVLSLSGAAGVQDARHRPVRARRSARDRRGPLSRLHDLHSRLSVRRSAEDGGCATISPSERRAHTLTRACLPWLPRLISSDEARKTGRHNAIRARIIKPARIPRDNRAKERLSARSATHHSPQESAVHE
jgi:hypothetical protein